MQRIAAAIKPADDHFARTRLLALENTTGGKVLPPEYLHQATQFAHDNGLSTHLDGARIFNAIVKQDIGEKAAVAGFDSVSVCLSKGLGAPAGSVLLASRDLIREARRWRKALGGGMRQAGVLAAAGLYALEHHVQRLRDDHANAQYLADKLRALGWNVIAPQTNVVYMDVPTALIAALKAHLAQRRVLASVAPRTRLVTHLDVSRAQLDAVLQVFREFPRGAVDR
jgi:threonine aldolase